MSPESRRQAAVLENRISAGLLRTRKELYALNSDFEQLKALLGLERVAEHCAQAELRKPDNKAGHLTAEGIAYVEKRFREHAIPGSVARELGVTRQAVVKRYRQLAKAGETEIEAREPQLAS